MPLYRAHSVAAAVKAFPKQKWILSGAFDGPATEPVLLNLADSAHRAAGDSLPILSTLLPVLAPPLEQIGSRRLTLEDSLYAIESLLDSGQRELTLTLARHLGTALAGVGDSFGILLCHPAQCDPDARSCLLYLIRRAASSDLCVVVCGPEPRRTTRQFLELMDGASRLPEISASDCERTEWGDEHLEGWQYLRTGGLAFRCSDLQQAMARLPAYLLGLLTCAPALLYENLVRLVQWQAFQDDARELLPRMYTLCARLAVSTMRPHRHDLARRFSSRALSAASSPESRAQAIVEFANLCASERRPSGLDRAAELCDMAAQVLEDVAAADLRMRYRIRLSNIRALVDYHHRDYDAALLREQEALKLARDHAAVHPEVAAWATPLIQRNVAQLYERAFGDRNGAASLLQRNLAYSLSSSASAADRANLAQIRFDAGDDRDVVDLLSQLYEGIGQPQDPERELYNRCMFAVSLWRLGMRSRLDVQLKILEALNEWVGSEGAAALIGTLASS